MTHKDFIAYLQKICQIDNQQCTMLLNALCKLMSQAGVEQVPVTLVGLGTFVSHKHPEYIEENPQTGLQVLYPPRISYRMHVEEEHDAITGDVLDQQLATMTKTSEAEVHRFIESLVRGICLALDGGEEAEIHGLGTFRIVSSRQNDLQRIAYTPDTVMRNAVNAPFSCFEPLEIPYRLAPVAEVVKSVEAEVEEPEVVEPAVVEPLVAEPAETVVAEPEVAEPVVVVPTEPEVIAPEPVVAPVIDATVEEKPVEEPKEKEPEIVPRKRRKRVNKDSTLVQFLFSVLALVLSILCFYYCTSFSSTGSVPVSGGVRLEIPEMYLDSLAKDSIDADSIVLTTPKLAQTETPKVNDKETPKTNPAVKDTVATKTTADPKGRMLRADGKLETYTLKAGDRLTLVSERYYGDKNFWPYIYELNKDKLKSPDVVPVGVTLYLPDKSYFGIDPKNAQAVRKAKDKAGQLLRTNNKKRK